MIFRRTAFVSMISLLLVQGTSTECWAADETSQSAQKILDRYCTDCHGAEAQESRLRLDSLDAALQGGDFGPAITPGRAADSEIIRRTTSRNPQQKMPPDGEALTDSEVEILRQWIDSLSPDMASAAPLTSSDPGAESHWAWSPLSNPKFPFADQIEQQTAAANNRGSAEIEPALNPIDLFIRSKLQELGIPASPPADNRTLARRLSYSLCGIPPDPDELQHFLNDDSPDAYEKYVDSLLNSPHYGERWARHWLDVVHYGDTHGYDKDKPRPNAWKYRDYVVRSFNRDKPYRDFIQEQIAGDALEPLSYDGVIATGFLAAGPWDFIGHEEVPESKTDGKIARHLDRDDMVANTLGTFCSVTVQCAQCHRHKFDPISQYEYYALQSVFAGIDRQDRPVTEDSDLMGQSLALERKIYQARSHERKVRQDLEELAKEDLHKWESLQKTAKTHSTEHGGYHSQIATQAESEKWVQIDLGESLPITAIEIHPCYDDFQSIGAGFGFPTAYRIEASNSSDFQTGSYRLHDQNSVPNSHRLTSPIRVNADLSARYIRITATRLAQRKDDFIFALAETLVLNDSNQNIALNKPVTAFDSIDSPPRWSPSNLVDGNSPAIRERTSRQELESLESSLRQKISPELWERFMACQAESERLAAELSRLELKESVYAVSAKKRLGVPRPIFVLSRGNVNAPRNEVTPGALSLVKSLPDRFELADPSREESRRLALANWVSSSQNSLTWRSIANRVWQFHFGAGIVVTANDFGLMGEKPSHPELLDWLALQLQTSGGSLKSLHRLIVTSATYRQASQPTDLHISIDSTNRYLGTFRRQRLDAESVRDSILQVAGTLDRSMGGPGWKDFVMERPEHSPHYRYDLSNPRDPATWRRSIYRFIVRSQTQPFMTSLDCADPSMRVDKRNESQSAIQALALLNNAFILAQSEALANQVRRDAKGDKTAEIEIVFLRILGRPAVPKELEILNELHASSGLENVCRTLFNLNEFLFVD
ncbi:DUF1553 domain-containing protein [Pirellulaceae bacterium SH501]